MELVSDWTESIEKPGYRVRVVKHKNCTIEIYRPILSDVERKKREAEVTRMMEGAMSQYYKRRELEKYEQQHNN